MIKTNMITKVSTITFLGSNDMMREYVGESFQYIEAIGSKPASFIDWLNGNPLSYTKPINLIVDSPMQYRIELNNYDTKFFSREFTNGLREYVEQKLYQKLNIHREELDYKFEESRSYGLPYLEKLDPEELDLFIKDAILSVVGVKEITKYIGTLSKEQPGDYGQNKLRYTIKFEVVTEEGELLWQMIEI